jgi:hypothetical protein
MTVSSLAIKLPWHTPRNLTRSHDLKLCSILLIDLGLDEPCQVSQRLLPTKITSLWWNDVRHACLYDIHLGADQYFLQLHRHLYFAGQVRIVESVRVTQAFARDELDISPPNAWLLLVVKFRKDTLNVPPTFGSR